MAVALTVTSVDNTQNAFIVTGTLVLTGNYGGASTHGDTVSFVANGIDIPSSGIPTVTIFEAPPAGTAPSGYLFTFCPGTLQSNGVVNISNNLTEYTEASAYSAGLLAAVLQYRAYFPSLI